MKKVGEGRIGFSLGNNPTTTADDDAETRAAVDDAETRAAVDDADAGSVLESRFSPAIARHFREIPWPGQSSQPPPREGEEEVNTNLSQDDDNSNKDHVVPSKDESHLNGLDSTTSESSLGNPTTTTTVKKSRKRGKRKVSNDDGSGQRKRRPKPKPKPKSNVDEGPSVPFEAVPLLQQTLISRDGSRPVFLYRKILEKSDILKEQNRLFVNDKEKLMEFLRKEEVAEVVGNGKGLKVVGIDGVGKVHKTVGVKEWSSLGKIAINTDWSQLVAANKARKGDVVEIWGYREKGKTCLGFNFLKKRGNIGDETRLRALAEAAINFHQERRSA